jgi:plastocyanin
MRKLFVAAAALAFGMSAPGAPIEAQSQPSVLTVHIKNFMFNPMTATIDAGDRVTFVNDDDEAHTATAVDHSFDSEGLDAHASFQHVFSKPGTYSYFCELHPYMKATIVVRAAGAR